MSAHGILADRYQDLRYGLDSELFAVRLLVRLHWNLLLALELLRLQLLLQLLPRLLILANPTVRVVGGGDDSQYSVRRSNGSFGQGGKKWRRLRSPLL